MAKGSLNDDKRTLNQEPKLSTHFQPVLHRDNLNAGFN
ncbi:hypothetical protein M5D96_013562 [Drosophila gunungcola]|uniref:Uncharacterized protein n=1 Tax=Drosophila gunungcola TaxID=103775 RepID=A0A9P9YB20_9MUSC|nr:hypothetical protein M5D96_013562 [Drosophila gunungcola]